MEDEIHKVLLLDFTLFEGMPSYTVSYYLLLRRGSNIIDSL